MTDTKLEIETICEHADGQSFVMLARVNGARYMLRTTTRGIPDYVGTVSGIVLVRHATASMRKLVVSATEIGQHNPMIDPVCAALLARGYPLYSLRYYVRHLYPNPEFIRGVLPERNVEDAIEVRLATHTQKRGSIHDRSPRVKQMVTPSRTARDRPPSWLIAHQSIRQDPLSIEIALPDAYEQPDDFAELLQRLAQLPPP